MTGSSNGSVFLLGGGLMQTPAIVAAGELQLQRHLADGNEYCSGRDAVEHFHHVDLRDLDGLVRVARTIPDLRAVFTAGTDFSRSVARVRDALDLPGIPFEVADRATDKGLMRTALQNGDVRVPRYVILSPGDMADAPPFPFPVVVKPVDNMGARGVVLVREGDEFSLAVTAARSASCSGDVIVEEYIHGQEYSIDALVYDGTVHVTGIGKRHIFFEPHFVELGHTMPANLSAEAEAVLTNEFTKAVHVLGITRGTAKGDIFLTSDDDGHTGAMVGEIAARLSGGFMSGWTYPLATGVPLTRLGLEIALGRSPEAESLRPTIDAVAVERALVSAPGVVSTVEVNAGRDTEVREIYVNCSPGDRVAPPQNNVEKVANVIVVSADRNRALQRAEEVLDEIWVVLEPGDPETDAFLFGSGWAGRYARYRTTDIETEKVLSIPVEWSATVRRATATPVVVAPFETFGGSADQLVRNHVSISANELTARLASEKVIRFDKTADREISLLFWKALVAGGRQGIRYLTDSLTLFRADAPRIGSEP